MTEHTYFNDEEITNEEELQLKKYQMAGPSSQQQPSIHKFLETVSESDDTTKTGNLKDEELGMPRLPVRTLKELALFSNGIGDMPYWTNFFLLSSEITTSTSLSLRGFLLTTAISTRSESTTKYKQLPTENQKKGWFKKKNAGEGGE